MATEEQLQNLHKLVWGFRALVAEYWLTPEPEAALRYAFTEAGEAMDALLREKRPTDRRNNDKDHDRLDEWADCAIMLLTALPEGYASWATAVQVARGGAGSDARLGYRVAEHMINPLTSVEITVAMIAVLPGMNLQTRVVDRLRRIMHKHVPPYRWGMAQSFLDKAKV